MSDKMIKMPMTTLCNDSLETTPKKFYCATGLSNVKNGKLFIEYMISKGFECTMNWTTNLTEYDTLHIDEVNAIDRADFIVVLLPGARGTHFEMGYAIGKNKSVYIYNIGSILSDIPFYKFCKPLADILPIDEIYNLFWGNF